jgi:hypothetical protein
MSNPQTFYKVGGLDLSNIFQPLSLGSQSGVLTKYNVPGYGDLNTIFAVYTSGTKATATGYTVTGYGDLNNIFAKYDLNIFPFNITGSTNYITGTLSNNYNIVYFRPGTFTVTPLTNVNIFQLFVVASGSTGIGRVGGQGGQILFNENTTVGANPIAVTPSNIISLNVGAAYNPPPLHTVTNTGNNSIASISGTIINYNALGGQGALGGQTPDAGGRIAQDGTQNIYTVLYYSFISGATSTIYYFLCKLHNTGIL